MAIRVCIAGSSGRMGRTLLEGVFASADLALSGALEQSGHALLGRDAGDWMGHASGVAITHEVKAALAASQVLIDFTRPEATLKHLELCLATGCALVIGTTGFSEEERQQIAQAAKQIPIVMAPNMSMGVNVTLALLDLAARVLQPGFDIEIIEAHHRHKVDAPSGTALRMGEVVAAARGLKLKDVAVYGREGITGERHADTIGFATVRGGDVVGDHTVAFLGTGERVEVTHKASSRATFAQGALQAARFLAGRAPGLYDMQDVLGLKALLPAVK
jgi:4-hydroxy-tetrahydrodipicolinate reductase